MLLQVLKLLLNWIFVCGIVQMCHYAMVNKVNTDRQTHREATLMRKKRHQNPQNIFSCRFYISYIVNLGNTKY